MDKSRASKLTRDNLGYLLARASRQWNEILYEMFHREGVMHMRPSHGAVLVPLYEEDDLRLGELAMRSGLSKQTMTTLIRKVEKNGLVTRRPDPEDGRAVKVLLTPKGRRLRTIVERIVGKLEKIATASQSDETMENVRTWLKCMAHQKRIQHQR